MALQRGLPFALFEDEFGVTCVSVPLADDERTAMIWKCDFDRLRAAGVEQHWDLHESKPGHQYVRCIHPGLGRLSVGQLVCAEQPDNHSIHYLNGDRLDLRRSNLVTGNVLNEE